MGYDVLAFLVTERCNFTCSHCCNDSHPRRSAVMDIEDVYRCIDQAKECGNFREIGISGGEPFLFLNELRNIIRYAADKGFSASITSNGYWATSEDKAYTILQDLFDCGLRSLNISVSPFHLKHTTPLKLRYALNASLGLGLVTRVNCVCTQTFRIDDARELFKGIDDAVEFVEIPLIPAGRAATSVSKDELSLLVDVPSGSCARFFTKLAITVNGDVFPCCSPGGFTEPLTVGNVKRETISDIIGHMNDNLLIQVLSEVGPAFFVPFIKQAYGENALDQHFVDQCHLCHTIMSDKAIHGIIYEVLAKLSTELSEMNLSAAMLAEGSRTPSHII